MIFDEWSRFLSYGGWLRAETVAAITEFRRRATADFPGGSYELDGPLVRASVFDSRTTAEPAQAAWEIHRDYADIQTMLVGTEVNYYRSSAGLTPTMAFDAARDYQLFKPELGDALKLTLTPARFAIYFPEEAHITSFNTGDGVSVPIRKIVFKIHRSLFLPGDARPAERA